MLKNHQIIYCVHMQNYCVSSVFLAAPALLLLHHVVWYTAITLYAAPCLRTQCSTVDCQIPEWARNILHTRNRVRRAALDTDYAGVPFFIPPRRALTLFAGEGKESLQPETAQK